MKNPAKQQQFIQDCTKCLDMSADMWLLNSVKDKLRNVNNLPFVEKPFDMQRVIVAFDKYHNGEIVKTAFNDWCKFYSTFIDKYAKPTTREEYAYIKISDILRNGCSKNSREKLAEIEHHNAILTGQIPADYELSSDWETYYTSVDPDLSPMFWCGRNNFDDWEIHLFNQDEDSKFKGMESDFLNTRNDFLELRINRFKKIYNLFTCKNIEPYYYYDEGVDEFGDPGSGANHVTRQIFDSLIDTVKLLGYTRVDYPDEDWG